MNALHRLADGELPVSTSARPVGGVEAEQPCLGRAAEVGLDDRDALAGVALDEREIGDERRLAVAGVGADEQDGSRGARAPWIGGHAELQRGVQSPQRLDEETRRRRLALASHERPPDLGKAGEHLRREDRLDVGERAQPAVEPAEGVRGDRREDEPDDEAEDRVFSRLGRDQQRRGGLCGFDLLGAGDPETRFQLVDLAVQAAA